MGVGAGASMGFNKEEQKNHATGEFGNRKEYIATYSVCARCNLSSFCSQIASSLVPEFSSTSSIFSSHLNAPSVSQIYETPTWK